MNYNTLKINGIILLLLSFTYVQSSLAATSYPIVDTGQILCYNSSSGNETTCSGEGFDADYDANTPSYTTSGAIVTDNITGLMWTQSSDLDGDGETTDADDKLGYSDAVTYCSNLTLDGYSDWRLPDIKTLYSLILFSGEDPSGSSTSESITFLDASFTKTYGDESAGERLIDGQYATSTQYVSTTFNGAETMFGVNFVDGRIKGYPTSNKTFYVLCTRGNESYGINSFTDNNDTTITDSATGLMWQKNDAQSTDFEDAVSICENASTADYSDWRVPNVKELQSIIDYTRSPDTTDSAAIDPGFNTTSIINEEGSTDWGYYWSNTTHANSNGFGNAGSYVSFGRALGYMNNSVMDVHGAGAQRSNSKMSENSSGASTTLGVDGEYFYYKGPQGDILRIDNMVRCVRSGTNDTETTGNTDNIDTSISSIITLLLN